MLSKFNVTYPKLKKNYDVAIFVTSCAKDTETNYHRPKCLNITRRNFHTFKSKLVHVLLGFGCPVLYVTISTLLGGKCHTI